ncbi:MAG: porin [Proteobacteria bacterium]|nr:porin [Pseudomonadota bacterium]
MKTIKKRHALAALTAAAVLDATPRIAAAQDSNQVYGQIRLTVNQARTGTDQRHSDLTEMRDNASRLGFRGREDLGDGMAAFYGLEMGFNADTGSFADPNVPFRNSYVGLRGSLGALALGRLDSANPTGSPLYSQVTAIVSFAPNDAGATAIGTSMLNARNRTSNSIGYASPRFGGFDMRARAYNRGADTIKEPEDSANSFDLGLNYAEGPIKAGIGWAKDHRDGGLATNEFDSKWQAGLLYSFSMVDLYALGGRDSYNNTAKTRADVNYWVVGTSVSFDVHRVTLNVLQRDVQASLVAVRKKQQLGYQYALSKRTELQAFYDRDQVDSTKPDLTVRTVGVGMRHDF